MMDKLVAEIDAKMKESCKLMADQMIHKAKRMEAIPTFSYCRPELSRQRKIPGLIVESLAKSRDTIRSVFGVPVGEDVAE